MIPVPATTPEEALPAIRALHQPAGARLGILTCLSDSPALLAEIAAVLSASGQRPARRLAAVRPRPGEQATRPGDLADFIVRYGHEYTAVVIDAALATEAVAQACAAEGCALVVVGAS